MRRALGAHRALEHRPHDRHAAPRGAFDYLLEPIRDQLQPPPPPPKRSGRSGPQRIRIEIEITDHRTVKRDMGLAGTIVSLILFGLLAWWGLFG